MSAQFSRKPRMTQELIPPLLIAALGTVGVVALYFLNPYLRPIDLALLLAIVGFSALGYKQGVVRGVATIVTLYLATGIAAALYQPLAPYAGGMRRVFQLVFSGELFGGEAGAHAGRTVDYDSLALSFGLLAIVVWILLEALVRSAFRDTSLPRLGILDNLGGVIVHLVVGVLAASLLFNTIGYGQWRRDHDKALLRRGFNQVLAVHYAAQSFWFPERPPPIYVYDLHLPHEP